MGLVKIKYKQQKNILSEQIFCNVWQGFVTAGEVIGRISASEWYSRSVLPG